MTNNVNLREAALDILIEVNEKEQFVHVVLSDALKKYQYLEKNERAFISRLVRGTVEHKITLDYVIDHVSKVPVKKMKPLIRNIIRMSAYQIMYMDSVPDSAACNEAVKLAGKRGFATLKGFVNGVLRNIIRELPKIDTGAFSSVKYSMPEYLCHKLEDNFGKVTAELIMQDFLNERKLCVFSNPKLVSAADLMRTLTDEGVGVTAAPYVDGAFYISNVNFLEDLKSFQKGYFHIQDVSSMLAVDMALDEDMKTVVDVCAAPGGKSIFASMKLNENAGIISRDLTYPKVEMILDNINRLGIRNIDAQVWDALELDEKLVGQADLVIADLPCSGIGIIGRKPDIKYNITEEKCNELAMLQRRILDVVTKYVKPGGYIMYSTCTLNPFENEFNVRYIESLGFKATDLRGRLPKELIASAGYADERYGIGAKEKLINEAEHGYVNLIPGIYDCDGFFMAKLRKDC